MDKRTKIAWGCALAGVGLMVAGSLLSDDSSSVSDVRGWYSSGGAIKLSNLRDDFGSIQTDANAEDVSSLYDDCVQLSTDVDAARSFKEIPDSETQNHWGAALGHFDKAADYCKSGTSSMDINQINESSVEMADGQAELVKATARLMTMTSN